MPNYYQGDVTKLSDAELESLAKEIEDSGVLSEDWYDGSEDSWKVQAARQWSRLQEEKIRRWDLLHPEAAEARRRWMDQLAVLNETSMRQIMTEAIFANSPLLDRLGSYDGGVEIRRVLDGGTCPSD
jgi:hypothetical protein